MNHRISQPVGKKSDCVKNDRKCNEYQVSGEKTWMKMSCYKGRGACRAKNNINT